MRQFLPIVAVLLSTSAVYAKDKDVVIASEGKPALSLSVPEGARIEQKGDKTTIQGGKFWLYVWPTKAKTVKEAVAGVGETIKSEFTDFAVKSNEAIKVAGHEARHLKGSGAEEDDGDPGKAEVVVFTTGKQVFVACVHGEGDHAAKEQADMLAVLKTAKVP